MIAVWLRTVRERRLQRAANDRTRLPESWVRYVLHIIASIFWHGDTIAIRALMALSSFALAVVLIFWPQNFERATWLAMTQTAELLSRGYLEPQWFWGPLYMAHAVGVIWRFAEKRSRVGWAIAINTLGVTIWGAHVALTTAAIGYPAAGSVLPCVCTVALIVSQWRTGLNDEKFTP